MSAFIGLKVQLRALTLEDAELLHRLNGVDSEGERFYDQIQLPLPLADFKKNLEGNLKIDTDSDVRNFAIETLDGKFAGEICCFDCNRRHSWFRCGFYILPEFRRRGLVQEAIDLILDFYFNELNYQKCNNYVYSINAASEQLHLKLGFVLEGRITNSYFTQGHYEDILYLGLSRDNYNKKKGR